MTKFSNKSFTGKVIAATLAVGTIAIATLSTTAPAEAKWGHKGALWGGLGAGLALGLVGSAIANSGPAYDDADYGVRRVCRVEPRYNDYGDYIGRVRVCRNVAY